MFATCVRVPVFIGHAEAVHVEFENPVTVGEARAALRDAPGRDGRRYARGWRLHHAGRMRGRGRRVRQPHPQGPDGAEHGLAFWCVADNLRKGAALNAVQIAETLVAQGLLQKRVAA